MKSVVLKLNFLVILMFLLTSCWTSKVYQISTIKSNNIDDNLVRENEDVKLSFDFNRCGGKLDFIIANKTNTPIFIDWAHSNFIFNGLSFNYFDNTQTIKSLGVYSSLKEEQYENNAYYESIAKITKEEVSIQVPPNSFISKNNPFGFSNTKT